MRRNNRFLEVTVRAQRQFAALESRLREQVIARVTRGQVTMVVLVDENAEAGGLYRLNEVAIAAYVKQMRALSRQYKIDNEVTWEELVVIPDVVKVDRERLDLDDLWKLVQKPFGAAMTQMEARPAVLTVVQDRVRLLPVNRARFAEACEQAFHFGKGRLAIHPAGQPGAPIPFSNRFHCPHCDIDYREPTPALFSINHPVGACPTCRGFGRTITIDYQLAIPDRSKTLAGGAVKPWQSGVSAECQQDLLKFCRTRKVPTDVPFGDLSPAHQDWVLNGEPRLRPGRRPPVAPRLVRRDRLPLFAEASELL